MLVLNSEEILQAQTIIDNTPAGIYELRDIYGSEWSKVSLPTTFGAQFKETVKTGLLQHVKIKSRKTNNHHTYEIV